jgi:hypothetical protein
MFSLLKIDGRPNEGGIVLNEGGMQSTSFAANAQMTVQADLPAGNEYWEILVRFRVVPNRCRPQPPPEAP